MDAVIAFVDMNDLDWQKLYYFYVKNKIDVSRYRDWGTLKYVLRGIQYNMPFIDKVHLVLMQESQIPSWLNVNADNLHIVYHKDFVPVKYLPTFNCNTLELHLHKIPGLAEQFIYFNDDMIPIHPSVSTDYFADDKVVMDFKKIIYNDTDFKNRPGFYSICANSENAAREMLGLDLLSYFNYTWRAEHTISPMFKSINKLVYSKLKQKDIRNTCSISRTKFNLNQYLYLDYLYHIDKVIIKELSFKYIPSIYWNKAFNFYPSGTEWFKNEFDGLDTIKNICINDYKFNDPEIAGQCIQIANDYLETVLPHKSKFEI